jgi:hypothetical protein
VYPRVYPRLPRSHEQGLTCANLARSSPAIRDARERTPSRMDLAETCE